MQVRHESDWAFFAQGPSRIPAKASRKLSRKQTMSRQRPPPHVEFWAPLWLEKDSHETLHWKLEHPFNSLVSNSSRSISPFFGVFIFPSRSRWTSGTFHKRLCWSTMKGGTWVPLLHCCKLQWAQYDVAVRCLQQRSLWAVCKKRLKGPKRTEMFRSACLARLVWCLGCWAVSATPSNKIGSASSVTCCSPTSLTKDVQDIALLRTNSILCQLKPLGYLFVPVSWRVVLYARV